MTDRIYNCTVDGTSYPMMAPDPATAAERMVTKLEALRTETKVQVHDPHYGETKMFRVIRSENPTYTATPWVSGERTVSERDEYRY